MTGFASAEVDRLLDDARATPDPGERRARYVEAERLVCRELPLLPLWFGVQYHLVAVDRFDVAPTPVDVFGEPVLRAFRPRA
jgi:oligopeptide transport system substrate-binding protein